MIWVYGRENNRWILLLLDPLRKALFSRLSIRLVHHLSVYPSAMLWLLPRLEFGHLAYFGMLRNFDFSRLRSIVFDLTLPKIAHHWPRGAVEGGLSDVRLPRANEVSWCVIVVKPGAGGA